MKPRYGDVTSQGWNITTSWFGHTPHTRGQANNNNNHQGKYDKKSYPDINKFHIGNLIFQEALPVIWELFEVYVSSPYLNTSFNKLNLLCYFYSCVEWKVGIPTWSHYPIQNFPAKKMLQLFSERHLVYLGYRIMILSHIKVNKVYYETHALFSISKSKIYYKDLKKIEGNYTV